MIFYFLRNHNLNFENKIGDIGIKWLGLRLTKLIKLTSLDLKLEFYIFKFLKIIIDT